jgi:hypothetical protein
VVLPLVGIAWIAAMAALATALARGLDWAASLGAIAALNLGGALLAGAVASRLLRRPARPR